MDRQNSKAIRNHIDTLWNDYSRSKDRLVLHFIEEWQNKYNLKLIGENGI